MFETVLDSVEGAPLGVATGLAYPLLDLVLLGIAVGALASTGWRLDRTWMLLAAGVVDVLARRLAVPRPHGRRASTSPAAGSTPAGGPAWP